MIKWINAHVELDVDATLIIAWVAIIGYAILKSPTFSAFWPAIISLAGIKGVHNFLVGSKQ